MSSSKSRRNSSSKMRTSIASFASVMIKGFWRKTTKTCITTMPVRCWSFAPSVGKESKSVLSPHIWWESAKTANTSRSALDAKRPSPRRLSKLTSRRRSVSRPNLWLQPTDALSVTWTSPRGSVAGRSTWSIRVARIIQERDL